MYILRDVPVDSLLTKIVSSFKFCTSSGLNIPSVEGQSHSRENISRISPVYIIKVVIFLLLGTFVLIVRQM
jgi:hypothetical protein